MNRETSQRVHSTYDRIMDKRKSLRLPVDMLTLDVDIRGQSSAFIYKTHIVNISTGGLCLEWNCCRECSGYTAGDIHPDCIFAPYSDDIRNSLELVFYVPVPRTDKVVDFKGKAVYTYKHESTEQVGIVFTEISDHTLELLMNIVRTTHDFNKKKEILDGKE